MPRYFDEDGNEVDPFAEPETPPEPQTRNPLRAQIDRLEKKNKELNDQVQAGQDAVRALEFAKAGVDLTDKRAQWFVKGYDGDLTTDAIKAAAVEAGFAAAAPNGTQDPGIPANELAAHQRMGEAAAGQAAPGARNFDAEIDAAKSPEDVDRLYAEKMAAAGHTGPAVLED